MSLAIFKKNKWVLLGSAALLLLASVLILDNPAFSTRTGIERTIVFDGKEWKMGADFDESWTTNKGTIDFTVNLEDDYENKYGNQPEEGTEPEEGAEPGDGTDQGEGTEPEPAGVPFTVTAEHGGKTVAVPAPTEAENFKGKYNVSIPFTGEGRLDIHIEIPEDNAWGAEPSLDRFHVTRDTTKPVIELEPEGLDGTLSQKAIEVDFSVSDENLEASGLEASISRNGEEKPLSLKWNKRRGSFESSATFKDDGEYVLTLKATDAAGNTETSVTNFAIRAKAPSMSLTNGDTKIAQGAVYNMDSVNVAVSSSIRLASAVAVINGQEVPMAIQSGSRTAVLEGGYTFPQDGKYDISVKVVERGWFGDTHELSPISFTVDRAKPAISFTGAEDGKIYEEDTKVEVIADDANLAGGKVTVTREGYMGQGAKNEYTLKDGKVEVNANIDGRYTFHVEASDKAGNTQTSEIQFRVDSDEPEISLSDPDINGKYFNADKRLDVSVFDFSLTSSPVLTIKKDGADYKTEQLDGLLFLYTKSLKFDDDGVYELNLVTKDFFGRESSLGPISFTIDKTKPALTAKGVENGGLYDEAKQLDVTARDTNLVEGSIELDITRQGKPYKKLTGEKALEGYKFTEDGEYTVNFKASDKAGNKTEIEPISFGLDGTPPALEINGVKEDAHYKQAEAALKVTDLRLDMDKTKVEILKDGTPQDIEAQWDTGRTEEGLKVAEIQFAFESEGDYVINLESADENGQTAKMSKSFTIDGTAPVISLDGISEGSFNQKGEILTIGVREHNFKDNDVAIKAWKDGKSYDLGEWENNAELSELAHEFNEDGDYEIEVSAEDKAGNKAETKKLRFTVDNIKPVIDISGPANGSYSKNPKDVKIQVTEHNYRNNDVNISVTRKTSAGGERQPYPIGEWSNDGEVSSIGHNFKQDGEYEIIVNSTDAAGNVAKQEKLLFTIDQLAPSLSITGVENGEDYRTDKPVTIKANDTNIDLNTLTLSVTRDGKAYNAGNFKLTSASAAELGYTFRQEGRYTINLKAVDKAGNETVHERIAFIIDKTTPAVAIDGVDDNSFNPSARQVTVSVDELNYSTNNVDIKATKDGREFNVGSWKNTGKLSKLGYNFNRDGLYTLSVSAEDKAGNGPAVKQKTFTIDTVKPAIDITGVENNQHYNVDKPVSVTIRDLNLDINRITVTRNGAGYNPGGFSVRGDLASLSHNFSAEGEYRIRVEATDKAGNSHSSQIAFTIDKTKPEITPKFKGQNRVIKNGEFINEVFTPEFALGHRDDSIVSITLNGSNIGQNVVASREMKYTYKVHARDKAGNETTMDISFTVDTTKPALNVTGVLDGFFNKDIAPRVTYSDIHLDAAKTSVTLNGAPFVNGAKLEKEQDYVLKAVVTDLATNVSTRTVVFTIDKTTPVIKFKEPISNKYFNEDLIPQLLIEDLNDYDIIALLLNGQPYELGDPIEDEGKHVLFFEVKDKAGNIQQLSVEFIIDKTAPKVFFDGAEENEKYRDPVDIEISLENPEDTIKSVTINGEEFNGEVTEEDGLQVIKTTLTDVKKYEVEVTAYDEAGNETTTVLPFEIIEKGALVKLYENKPLFAGTIAGVVGAAAAATVFALRRRKAASPKAEEE